MTITVSINAVGILRATDMLQSALNDSAKSADDEPRTTSVNIGRFVDPDRGDESGDPVLPASQERVVDIRV